MSDKTRHETREPWFWSNDQVHSFVEGLKGQDVPTVISAIECALSEGGIEPEQAVSFAKAIVGFSPWISAESYDPAESRDWHVAKTLAWIATRSSAFVMDFDHEALKGRSAFAVAMRPPPEGIESKIGAWDHWVSVPADDHPSCELATYVLIHYEEDKPSSFVHQGGLGEALRKALADGRLVAVDQNGAPYPRQKWRSPDHHWGGYFWPRQGETLADANARYEDVLFDRDEILAIWPPIAPQPLCTEQKCKRKALEIAAAQAEKSRRVVLAQVERELLEWALAVHDDKIGTSRMARYLGFVRERYGDQVKPGAPSK